METWSNWVLKHRRIVVLLWVIVALAGGGLAGKTVDRLSYDFGLPGSAAYETNQQIVNEFRTGGNVDPLVLTATPPAGGSFTSPALVGEFDTVAAKVAAAAPGTKLVPASSNPVLVARDGSLVAALLYPPIVPGADPYIASLDPIKAATAEARVGGSPLTLTGVAALMTDTGGGEQRGVFYETLHGGLGALFILVLVFGSLLAGVPLLVAIVSILATFLCLFGLTQVTDVVFVVQFLIALIGLGVAIDYSLLIVMRWREEHANGADNETAVRLALRTAGRSVIFSGVTVAISLASLMLVPVPFMRSVGLAGLLIPLMSVLTAVTLLPVLLLKAGPKLSWPRKGFKDPSSKTWRRVATVVVRRPLVVAAVTMAALIALSLPVQSLRLGSPLVEAYENGGPAAEAADRIAAAGMPIGIFHPVQILAPAQAVQPLTRGLPTVEGISGVMAYGESAGQTLLLALTQPDAAGSEGSEIISDLKDKAKELGATGVGGLAAEDADFVGTVYGKAPLALLFVVVATFLLLARALGSIWLPIKALILNAISITAAFGITTWIWQGGHGTEAVFDTAASGAITTWLPAAAFAFLFGLSMDYEVFILSRIREAYDKTGDTSASIVTGIANTGRLVTSAAAILFLSFVALSTVPAVDVKILATALALGIAIDAIIVRAFLAPALVQLMGKYNWYWPSWFPGDGKPPHH